MIMTDTAAAAISVAGYNPGATSHIIYLLIAFLFGAALSSCVCLWIHRMHKKAWQSEYRRLMTGIDGAIIQLDRYKGLMAKGSSSMVSFAIKILRDTYRGE